MEMTWKKLGKIFRGHAQMPVLWRIDEDLYRVFVTARTDSNKSYIKRFDFDLKKKVAFNENKFACGMKDGFDSDGVMASCVLDDKMYYTAWKKTGENYRLDIGVFTTDFREVTDRKLLIESTQEDFYLCCSPFVVKDRVLKMWFVSGNSCGGWTTYGPRYGMRYAESENGTDWLQKNVYFPRGEDEVFSRPFVRLEGGTWKMWYSYLTLSKTKAYRIGYAESEDGLNWKRLDSRSGIDISERGWDSKSVAFPFIVETIEGEFMFYSGNEFGKGGLGYAIRKV